MIPIFLHTCVFLQSTESCGNSDALYMKALDSDETVKISTDMVDIRGGAELQV